MAETPADGSKGPTFTVMFGSRDALGTEIPEYSVLIVPADVDASSQNDFRQRTRVEFRVRFGPNRYFSYFGFIGFLGLSQEERNGAFHLQGLIENLGELTLAATPQHKFFTMLSNMEDYRLMLRTLGQPYALPALIASNDIVAWNETTPAAKWIGAATRNDAFQLSFVRDSEAYFAYKNAGPMLRGLEQEELGKLSPSLSIRFQLRGFSNVHAFTFNFNHTAVLPKRIAILIGKNGVGKSQTLGRIVRAALRGSNSLIDTTNPNDNRPVLSRLLAFAPTNESESVFPNPRRQQNRVWYRRFSLNRSRRSKKNEDINDLIIQLARSPQEIRGISRFDIFLTAMRAIYNSDQICLPTTGDAPSFVAISDLQAGSELQQIQQFASIDLTREPVRVVARRGYPLSSGEISFLRFAAQVSLHIENGSLLLLDEPETHLHPNFISRFVALLDGLLSQTGSAAIISTHSVYFIREVFREQVTVVSLQADRSVQIEHPKLRTFGADVGAISCFVFDEDESSRLASEVKEKLLAMQLPWNQLYERYKGELSLEFLSELRSTIEDADR